MQDRFEEIHSYLSHNDYSVAIRRILDLSLDTGDDGLMRASINWSRRFRKAVKDVNQAEINSGGTEAHDLLSQLQQRFDHAGFESRNVLDAKEISKTYPAGNFRLHPISLQVFTGDVIGMVGENGNGKTTLLRCLARQLSVDEGDIHYTTLNQPDDYSIRHHLAFIPQRIPRWYGALKDNLHFSASISGIYGHNNELMVDFMLERMDLAEYAHLNWDQVSSGYRTRFEIARVLLQRPTLMLLDEPLANLDILAQQTLLSDLRYMAKSYRHPMGVVLSSQQLHEVEKIADYVLFLRNGECLHRSTENQTAGGSSVVEIETAADREVIASVFESGDVQIHFNGGYYTLSSSTMSAQEIISRITSRSLPITYFRDISHSTKRFF